MREHDALAATRSSRRVRQHDDITVRDWDLFGEWCAGHQIHHRRDALDRVDGHHFDYIGTFDCLVCHVEEHRDGDQHGCAGIL